MSNKKNTQLGMNHSTAQSKLIRDLLWDCVVKLGEDKCFRCKEKMTRETFSVEHIKPWLDSENPKELFFNLNNINYSHRSCNYRHINQTKKNNSSKFRGVSSPKSSKNTKKRYQANLCAKEKRIYLGRFESEIEAAKAYDKAAKEYFGERAYLNFPD